MDQYGKDMGKLDNWVSPFLKYYRVSDEIGAIRLETVNLQEAQEYIKSQFESNNKLMNIEIIKR